MKWLIECSLPWHSKVFLVQTGNSQKRVKYITPHITPTSLTAEMMMLTPPRTVSSQLIGQTGPEQYSLREDKGQFAKQNTVPRWLARFGSWQPRLSQQGPLIELMAANYIKQQLALTLATKLPVSVPGAPKITPVMQLSSVIVLGGHLRPHSEGVHWGAAGCQYMCELLH